MSKNSNKDLRRFEQEKQEFIDGLRNFHYNRGTRFQNVPRCGNKEVDLYLLYQKVTERGGWKKVTEHQKWDEVLDDLKLPKRCLNADQAVKNIYFRYLNVYEQIHFLGEDPKTVDTRRDDEGPIRKKLCGPQYGVPMSYNYAQHDVAANLRGGYGLCTTYAKRSSYDKLEKALLSGLPNEVDFVINVCTLLSNESKHTLRLDKCAVLTDLLLAHIGLFEEEDIAMEKLYENGWRKNSGRDFIRFWYDTVENKEARELISFTREDSRDLCGKEVLQLGRNLGVEDREGIRITQIAIIIRNLSFDLDNMKYLANHDNVFRFMYLCLHCSYGTLRQLALDTLGNLAGRITLDPADSFKAQTMLDLLASCLTSTDKLAVVSGLEMVSKLSKQEENEYVLSERMDSTLYEEIAKYLTISDIQLIVYSLEALYQLSEIGPDTNSKIAEVSNTVDTLVSLITVEAQSYGPNSLIGIKVVEYCPPPHLTGGVPESSVGAVGQPPGTGTPQPSQSQPPGQHGSMVHANTLNKGEKGSAPEAPVGPTPMETTSCNWMKATYDMGESAVTSHITMYREYLAFCKKFQLNQPLASQEFLKCLRIVFPKSTNCMAVKEGGAREMCVLGIKKREQQLPFSISCPVPPPACSSTVAPSVVSTVRPPSSALQSPNLAQRLALPLPRPGMSMPMRPPPVMPHPQLYKLGSPGQQPVQQRPPTPVRMTGSNTVTAPGNTVTAPVCTISGAVLAQGYMSTQENTAQPIINTLTSSKTKQAIKKKAIAKKNAPILPRPDQSTGNLPNIVPRLPANSGVGQQTVVQQPMVQNVQFFNPGQDVVYQDAQNPEAKVMVKTLLAKKIRQGNVIIQQPVQGVMNVDLGGGGDGQTIQYQTTNFPQNVQQTTYIQYTPQQTGGQTYIQSQPTSQVQTFVVQQGDMYVQGQVPTSSLNTQIVAQQQPLVVNPQQQIIAQPQVIVSQQPMVMSQQPLVVSQQQFINQQPTLQSQIIAQSQFVSQNQVIIQPSADQLTGQPSLQMSSAFSSIPTTISTLSSVSSASESIVCVSASQLNKHSSDINSISDNLQSQNTTGYSVVSGGDTNSMKPSNGDSDVNSTLNVVVESSEAVEELESAVGSIMEEPTDDQEAQEEPVMIENDGNELMFEQNQYTNNTTEIYETDEAAMAVEQLMDNSGEMNECGNVEMNEVEMTMETNEEINESCAMITDQINNGETLTNGMEEYKEGSVEKEAIVSDAQLIAQFRAETPINVPIVSENGLLEQDFEARMAVENLLKDVEFKVSGTDEDSLEGNVNMLLGQQENPDSVKTASSGGENDNIEDSRDSISSESQTIHKKSVVNHNGSSITSKSSDKHSHDLHNGIDNGDSKPLLNGDLSSPECPLVPSPSAVNGGEPTQLVNGISEEELEKKAIDKLIRINGVVNHKVSPKLVDPKGDSLMCEEKMDEISAEPISDIKTESDLTQNEEINCNKTEDILAQSIIDSRIDKNSNDSTDQNLKVETGDKEKDSVTEGDILAQSILENDIQPSDCEMPDPEPTSVTAVVKQIIPSTVYGNIMTVQINNSTIPITFNNALISTKTNLGNQSTVCYSRHIPTPESARDGDQSCDSTNSSIVTSSDLSVSVSDKHSIAVTTSKKDSKKSLTSPKSSESKKSKSKKRNRSKSGGSGSNDSRPSSVTSPAASTTSSSLPEFMCEWAQCRQCFNNAKSVFHHVCSAHLKTEYDGLCKWEGCETLSRKRWSLFTHVQDHHCSESSLRVAAQRRLQSFQTGQKIAAPTIPAMVYPNDAANQAIKRFLPKPPYPEFMEGREGPVTKHIRLTSALILRNLAKYSPAGRSLLRKHERVISYTCMSGVESSTALAKCLHELAHYQ